MIKLAVLAFVVAGCGSSATPQEMLVGNWIYVSADGTSGFALDFKGDNTYAMGSMALTSATSANAEIETGGWTATDSAFTLTPREWTCAGPDPVYSISYSFQGAVLVTTDSTVIISLERNTATATTSFALTLGCFDNAGVLVPAPLAPVSN